MIVVRIELWSAVTGQKTEIGRMHITNDGTGTNTRRNYIGQVFRKPKFKSETRSAKVDAWPSLDKPVWALVGAVLKAMGYVYDS